MILFIFTETKRKIEKQIRILIKFLFRLIFVLKKYKINTDIPEIKQAKYAAP